VVRFYNSGGQPSMDQGGQAGGEDDASLLPSVRSNQVRLALSLLAYNLGNLWRRLALPRRIENWSLTVCSNGW